jgi:hypothetical protein
MPAIFTPRANLVARATLAIAGGGLVLLTLGAWALSESAYVSRVGYTVEQPVPFSHKHHVAGLGIDCRYCHQHAEDAPSAGMPATETCMNCHQQIWTDAPLLEPVRESWRTNQPLVWNRVHSLPDHVYFNHSIHVSKGMGCASCHGRVDEMQLMRKEKTLFMRWCLDCHRHPGENIRPREEVYNLAWRRPPDDPELGSRLLEDYRVRTAGITNCTTCHR